MNKIVFPAPTYDEFAAKLLADRRESCAIVFLEGIDLGSGCHRNLVQNIEYPPGNAYAKRSPVAASLKPQYVFQITAKARSENFGVLLVHTHPNSSGSPKYSPIDDDGEVRLAAFLNERVPNRPHFTMIVGPEGCRARYLGGGKEVKVIEVGPAIRTLFDPSLSKASTDDTYDRQIRAFGPITQTALERLTVAVVGLGGTGSVTAQQLAHLGVRSFIFIDPDVVDVTNLNRVVGATKDDIGKSKVAVAARYVCQINPRAKVKCTQDDINYDQTARILLDSDFIFTCTDSHASRAVVGQLSYQYLIPCIDMGVSISIRKGEIAFVTGRVQMLAPTLPCLTCINALEPQAVRRELMTPQQRTADPYLIGTHEPQPAVISLNSTVASLAVTMFLGAVTPIPAQSRMQIYDGIRGTVRNVTKVQETNCIVCSNSGSLAKGDRWSLPTRRT